MADDQTIAGLFGSDSEEEPQQEAQPASENAPEDGDAATANGNAPQGDQMRDLFGSDDDDEDDDAGPSKPSSAAAPAEDDGAYYREPTPEEEDEVLRGPPMRVSVPLHDVLDTDQLRLTKLSNIISIEPRPFDPETYEPNGTEYIDDRGQKRVRLHDSNAIRWRWAAGDDGNLIRESNSRLVRWSDGSVTLAIGDEVMDVREIDVSGDHSYLFARHPNLIQGQGPLNKKITLRPASLTSSSHKRLAAAVVKHHGNAGQQRVRATTTMVDPKKEKEEQERAEAARIKDLEKLADKQQKTMRKYKSTSTYSGGSYGGGARNRPTALNARFLEEDEEEEEEEDEEDDGFIVRDEDMEPEEGRGAGELEDEDEEEEEEPVDVGRLVSRPRARDYEEEAEAERRLAAAKTSAPPAAPAAGGGGGGILKDSDDEEGGEEEKQKDSGVKKKARTMLMESDSE
jgi:RNA polymerase-associated protein LEO1